MKLKKMMLGLNLAILPIASTTAVISCNSNDKKSATPVKPIEEIAKTIADLQTEITKNVVEIKAALSGNTSEMTIDKVKRVLKEKLDNSFYALINGLTLKSKEDAKVVLKSGEVSFTIITSTTKTPSINMDKEFQLAITNKNMAIKEALSGETIALKLTIVKSVLKDKLDNKFNDLINGLTLVGKPINGIVVVKSGSTIITISTSTTTSVTKTLIDFKNAINDKKDKISEALSGEPKEINLDRVKVILKEKLDNSFDTLIETLTWVSSQDKKVIVKLGVSNIEIKTTAETSQFDLLANVILVKKDIIATALDGKTSEMTIAKIQAVLKENIEDEDLQYYATFFTLKGKPTDKQVVLQDDDGNELIVVTSTTTPVAKTLADFKSAINAKKDKISEALSGEPKDINLDRVKVILKEKLDNSFDTLIEDLTWVSSEDGKVIVKSWVTNIEIKTSTKTSQLDLLANAILAKKDIIATALDGKTSEMTIAKIQAVLKENIEDEDLQYYATFFTLKGKPTDKQVVLQDDDGKELIVVTSTIT